MKHKSIYAVVALLSATIFLTGCQNNSSVPPGASQGPSSSQSNPSKPSQPSRVPLSVVSKQVNIAYAYQLQHCAMIGISDDPNCPRWEWIAGEFDSKNVTKLDVKVIGEFIDREVSENEDGTYSVEFDPYEPQIVRVTWTQLNNEKYEYTYTKDISVSFEQPEVSFDRDGKPVVEVSLYINKPK